MENPFEFGRELGADELVNRTVELEARSDRKVETPLSCPERVRLGEQSLNINQRVAVELAEILTAFLLTNSLRRFATYFDIESGTSRSLYCTPEKIENSLEVHLSKNAGAKARSALRR